MLLENVQCSEMLKNFRMKKISKISYYFTNAFTVIREEVSELHIKPAGQH